MRVCRASRCRFDTQWEVFSKQQEMAVADRGPITAALTDHAMPCDVGTGSRPQELSMGLCTQ